MNFGIVQRCWSSRTALLHTIVDELVHSPRPGRYTVEVLSVPTGTSRVAYAFYAADNTHAIAAMVCATLLRKAGASADFVLVHLPLSPFVMGRLQEMGIRTQLVAPLDRSPSWYYRDCLVKLHILHLTDYARVIYMDVDTAPLKSLDDLFALPLGAPLAASPAYWLPQPYWSSHLLVAAPSEELWKRVRRRLERTPRERRYDMDVINAEFGNEIHSLPPNLTLLNSEWEDRSRPHAFGDPSEAFRSLALIHFSALGKPWSYTPQRSNTTPCAPGLVVLYSSTQPEQMHPSITTPKMLRMDFTLCACSQPHP